MPSQEKEGDEMLADTIQAVKTAEDQAEQIIAQAHDQSSSLLHEARLDAERIREKADQDAQEMTARRIEEAKSAGNIRLKEASEDAAKKCAQLRSTASEEENAAIEKVISLVIG
ncbi:MAG: hypothetical protein ACI4ET_08365 [Bilifractor sp.]